MGSDTTKLFCQFGEHIASAKYAITLTNISAHLMANVILLTVLYLFIVFLVMQLLWNIDTLTSFSFLELTTLYFRTSNQ